MSIVFGAFATGPGSSVERRNLGTGTYAAGPQAASLAGGDIVLVFVLDDLLRVLRYSSGAEPILDRAIDLGVLWGRRPAWPGSPLIAAVGPDRVAVVLARRTGPLTSHPVLACIEVGPGSSNPPDFRPIPPLSDRLRERAVAIAPTPSMGIVVISRCTPDEPGSQANQSLRGVVLDASGRKLHEIGYLDASAPLAARQLSGWPQEWRWELVNATPCATWRRGLAACWVSGRGTQTDDLVVRCFDFESFRLHPAQTIVSAGAEQVALPAMSSTPGDSVVVSYAIASDDGCWRPYCKELEWTGGDLRERQCWESDPIRLGEPLTMSRSIAAGSETITDVWIHDAGEFREIRALRYLRSGRESNRR